MVASELSTHIAFPDVHRAEPAQSLHVTLPEHNARPAHGPLDARPAGRLPPGREQRLNDQNDGGDSAAVQRDH